MDVRSSGWRGSLSDAARRLLVGLAFVIGAGCSDSSDRPETDEFAAVSISFAFELGQTGTTPLFGRVGGLAVAPDGAVFVLDHLAQSVFVFGSDGRFERQFGRRGEGPLEFSYADGVAVAADGSSTVYDARGAKMVRFDAQGSPLTSFSVPRGGGVTPWPGTHLSSGRILHWLFAVGGPGERTFTPYAVSEDGAASPFATVRTTLPTRGDERIPMDGFFALGLGSDETVWFSDLHEYRLTRTALTGDTLSTIDLSTLRPQPVTGSEVDSIQELYRTAGMSWPAADLPTRHPIVERVFSDLEGTLFVVPRLEGRDRGRVIHLFDEASGEGLGEFELPFRIDRFTQVGAQGRRVAVVRVDELDVGTVYVFDVDLPW